MYEIRDSLTAIMILFYELMSINWDVEQKPSLRLGRRSNRRVVINYSCAFVEVRIVTFAGTSKLSRAYRLPAVPVVRNVHAICDVHSNIIPPRANDARFSFNYWRIF